MKKKQSYSKKIEKERKITLIKKVEMNKKKKQKHEEIRYFKDSKKVKLELKL